MSLKKFFKNIFNFFVHFIRRILYFATQIFFYLICQIIFLVTYEPHQWKKVTLRKIRRIRALTKFKLWMWKHFGWYFRFIRDDKYYRDLEKRFG